MTCRAPAMSLPRRVLRESPRLAGKIRTANRETPRGSRKKPYLGRSLIRTHHAVPLSCRTVALKNRLQSGMVGARLGHGIVRVN